VPHVAVNLSGRSFHQKGFAQNVSDNLAPAWPGRARPAAGNHRKRDDGCARSDQENIELLSQQGFRLSLDDFGTGYSSLSYLHRLPITELKLDKSFVQPGTQRNGPSAHDFRAEHRKSLGMTVVAEGVETSQQCRWLKEHGCEVMQGYLLGRPLRHMLHAWSLEASAVCCS
jgi:EAL domain-containing protein (putative c-di-GMP-specific phosphodiesterase class I)